MVAVRPGRALLRGRYLLALAALPALALLCLLAAGPGRAPPLEVRKYGGQGPPTLVLLHGYGSSAARFEPFTLTIRLPPAGRFLFPEGPERTAPPDGPADGRAWWPLGLADYTEGGRGLPDLSRAAPPGLGAAAGRLEALLRSLGDGARPLILGGFSQGAMVAAQVAARSEVPLAGLVLLSGTPVDEEAWARGLERRRGLPVFLAHGRGDDVLSFALAERLRARLEAAGLRVTWRPFDGGHEIPAEVVGALNGWLAALLRGGEVL